MNAEQIKKAIERSPFEPFTIFLSDQRTFEVPHPEYIWLLPNGRAVAIADETGAADILALVHVTGLKVKANGA